MFSEDVLKINACTSGYFKNLESKDSQTLYLVNSGTVINDVPVTDLYYGESRVRNVSVVETPPTQDDDLTPQRFYLLKQDDEFVKLYFKYRYEDISGVTQTKILTALDLGVKVVDNSYEVSTDILFEDNSIARLLKVSENGDLPDEIVNTLINEYDLYNECSLLWRKINPEVVISRFDKVTDQDQVTLSGTGKVVVTILDFKNDAVLLSSEVSLTSSLSTISLPKTNTPVKFKLQETFGSQLQGLRVSGTSIKGLRVDCKNLTLLDLEGTNLFDLLITSKCTELSTVNLKDTKIVERLGRLTTIIRELPSRSIQSSLVVGDISSSILDSIESEASKKNWNIVTNI